MAAVIGSLRAELRAEIGRFADDMGKAGRHVEGFAARTKRLGAELAKVGAVMGTALVAGAAGLAFAMRGVLDDADKIGKTAQSIGIPIEELSRLKHAAELSGIGLDQLATGVGRLSRNMLDAQRGLEAPARAFRALGISVAGADGTLKSSSQIMTEVGDRFARMEDGAAKTALAMELFGRAGADMIPMLNQGGAGLRALMAEADQLGIVIEAKTAKAAEAFNDNLTRLGRVQDGIVTQITARMLPALVGLSEQLLEGAKSSRLMDQAAKVLTATLRVLVTGAIALFKTIEVATQGLSRSISGMILLLKGDFSGALKQVKAGWSDIAGTVKGAIDSITNVWTDGAAAVESSAPGLGAKIAAPFKVAVESIDKDAKKLADQLQSIRDAVDPVGAAVRGYAAQMELAKQAGVDLAEAQRVFGAEAIRAAGGIDVIKAKIAGLPPELAKAVLALEQAKIGEGIQRAAGSLTMEFDPGARIEQRLREIDDAWRAGKISVDVYKAAVKDTWESMGQSGRKGSEALERMDLALDRVGQTLADLIFSTGDWKDSLLGLAKQLTQALFIDPFLGGVRQWAGGGGLGQVAGGVLQGLFGGFRAAGGPVTPGRSYVVGETGPEMFRPRQAGEIVPGRSAVGVVQNNTWNISTPDVGSFRATDRQLARRARMKLSTA